jgi:two-component system heavy metal sensor histidine kinase CusS
VKTPGSMVARLTIWYVCSAFTLVLIASIALYAALVANLNDEDEEFAADIVNIVRAFLRDRPEDVQGLKQTIEWEWSGRRYAQLYVRVLDGHGRSLIETPHMPLDASRFPHPVPADVVPEAGVEVAVPPASFRTIAALARVGPRGTETRVVQVALGQAREQKLLEDYRQRLWVIVSIAFVASSVAGHAIARRGVRPLAEITEATRRVRLSTLDRHIHAEGFPTELSALAETFNTMLSGLEESFSRLSRFSADIAHELRTPVNNIRGEAEVALQQARTSDEYRLVLESLLEEAVRLSRTIDSLLFVARAENPATQIARETVDLVRELDILKDVYEPVAAEAGVTLDMEVQNDVLFSLDRTLWQRAISNVVANALDHTASGGRVVVTASKDGDTLCVDVTDTGCGIAQEHLPHVFERFYRVDPSRGAHPGRVGLGLAIVRSVVALHGGTVEITSEVGRGTTVTLHIPPESLPVEAPGSIVTVS